MPKGDKLNIRQERFINNLLKGMTQTAAYIEAGYSAKNAMYHASHLANNSKIKPEIERRKKEQEDENKFILWTAQEELIHGLLQIARTAESEAVRLAAIKDGLDRTGLKPVEKHEYSGEMSIEHIWNKIIGTDDDGDSV